MAPTMLPFLYQTRTLQRLTRVPFRRQFSQSAGVSAPRYDRSNDAIPFEGPLEGVGDGQKDTSDYSTTMTPSEAEVFKSIFDDISHGNMPRPSKFRAKALNRDAAASASASDSSTAHFTSGSLVEQARHARLSDFREKVLQRFPAHLRQAAETALNLYEFAPSSSPSSASSGSPNRGSLLAVAQANLELRQEKEECDRKREEEKMRLDKLLDLCNTEASLWTCLEEQVFVLPAKLHILEDDQSATKTKKKKTTKWTSEQSSTEPKYSMDIYGPLYSHLLLKALDRFDTGFAEPSIYAFNILPKVKSIGLPSYVLGVSTAFYTRLARMHWERYGDATSALEMLDEMNSIGLQPDIKVHELLVRIRDELHACASGSHGPFVAAIVESPPYDAALLQRLEGMEAYVRDSLMDAQGEFGV